VTRAAAGSGRTRAAAAGPGTAADGTRVDAAGTRVDAAGTRAASFGPGADAAEARADAAQRAAARCARAAYGRLVAYLAYRWGDVAAAEDALADALERALRAWPDAGVPASPEAWLMTAARNRLLETARHDRVRRDPAVTLLFEDEAMPEAAEFPDDRLKLLFVCAHPALDAAMHTPLMLQTVLGFDAARIGAAFLVAPTTMGQRLSRAKAKIRAARIGFEVPGRDELAPRIDAVCAAIYAAYGRAWNDASGREAGAGTLAEEAVYLARLVVDLVPAQPEPRALLALMLHCEARRDARRSAVGAYVPLSEQDPAHWNRALMAAAEAELRAAARARSPGRFQLEAAIQSAHAERAFTGRTPWTAIAALYRTLLDIAPSIGAAVAHAAASAESAGAAAGLALLDALDDNRVAAYQPYWAVRAHLLAQAGRDGAPAAYRRAIGLSEDPALRDFLHARMAAMSMPEPHRPR
jgi:RNA polymerase sigma-70 factor (ECF subfamily)